MNNEQREKMAVYDIIFGLILVCSSLFFGYESILLRRPDGWLTAPGLPPLLIYASLGIMGLFLLVGSIRQRGLRALKEMLYRFPPCTINSRGAFSNKILILIGIYFVYMVLLVRILPFEISTFLYLFVIFKIFYKRTLLQLTVSALLITAFFTGVFTHIFKVILPGVAWSDFVPFLF